ncbi:MAG: metallophosphoesterase [Candidatus Aenigmarchaeota archaeon]|nr:metallophosphoesterase [Candidatus Aenigmarchaeota archaeon]
MIIYAISDLDTFQQPAEKFAELIKGMEEPDLLLFAGDMYEFGTPEEYIKILNKIKWKCPIIAVFGNREFPEEQNEIKKYCKGRITFLEDETKIIKDLGIVGSRGCLDYAMFFQISDMLFTDNYYEVKLERIKKLLSELKTKHKLLLTHFAPTYKTLTGESKEIYPGLGSKKLEKIMKDTGVTFAIHGHAHYGKHMAFVGKIPVYNVSYQIKKAITVIDTDKLPKRKF